MAANDEHLKPFHRDEVLAGRTSGGKCAVEARIEVGLGAVAVLARHDQIPGPGAAAARYRNEVVERGVIESNRYVAVEAEAVLGSPEVAFTRHDTSPFVTLGGLGRKWAGFWRKSMYIN